MMMMMMMMMMFGAFRLFEWLVLHPLKGANQLNFKWKIQTFGDFQREEIK